MNYYPYKEAAYLNSGAIFETDEILATGGVVDHGANQYAGGGLSTNYYNRKDHRRL